MNDQFDQVNDERPDGIYAIHWNRDEPPTEVLDDDECGQPADSPGVDEFRIIRSIQADRSERAGWTDVSPANAEAPAGAAISDSQQSILECALTRDWSETTP